MSKYLLIGGRFHGQMREIPNDALEYRFPIVRPDEHYWAGNDMTPLADGYLTADYIRKTLATRDKENIYQRFVYVERFMNPAEAQLMLGELLMVAFIKGETLAEQE